MRSEFKKALGKKRIVRFSRSKELVGDELKAAHDDLTEAEDRFCNERYKYATVTAYYSMFHTARALLYSEGFREKSHYWLVVALQALFVDKGLLDESHVESLHDAMVLREDADYHGNFSKEGAEVTLESARAFLEKAEKILT